MKLEPILIDYYSEVGEIVRTVERLKKHCVQVVFDKDGMRVSETFGNGIRGEYYYTASELRSYLRGLEDGFWHAVRVDQELFEDAENSILKDKQS